jgi:hypothetical protein
MVENLVEEIGYEMQRKMKVHYLMHVLTMSRIGLRQIRDDHDTTQMINFVEIGHHFISIYLDHDESLETMKTTHNLNKLISIFHFKQLTIQKEKAKTDSFHPKLTLFSIITSGEHAGNVTLGETTIMA